MRAGNFKATFTRYLPELPGEIDSEVKDFLRRHKLSTNDHGEEYISGEHKSLVHAFFVDLYRARAVYPEAALLGLGAYPDHGFKRNSDTVFILGCGASLNQLSDEDWARVGRADSIGVNYFYCHPFRTCGWRPVNR